MKKGYVQIYTGNGKGKTTAALGLILRASGAKCTVFLGQFMKSGRYSEMRALKARFPGVVVRQFGTGRFVRGKPAPGDLALARKGLDALRRAMTSGRYDIVIADEACTAAAMGVVKTADLLSLVKDKPPFVELVLTGRKASPALIRSADLVTEMREIKHYFAKGVIARAGIEY